MQVLPTQTSGHESAAGKHSSPLAPRDCFRLFAAAAASLQHCSGCQRTKHRLSFFSRLHREVIEACGLNADSEVNFCQVAVQLHAIACCPQRHGLAATTHGKQLTTWCKGQTMRCRLRVSDTARRRHCAWVGPASDPDPLITNKPQK